MWDIVLLTSLAVNVELTSVALVFRRIPNLCLGVVGDTHGFNEDPDSLSIFLPINFRSKMIDE